MRVSPEKYDWDFWKDIFKLLSRLSVVAMVFIGGSGAVDEVTHVDLKRSEARAATVDNRVIEAKRETNVAYEDWNELATFYVAKDAACDSALESLSRHRADNGDFAHVLEECHSEGEIE